MTMRDENRPYGNHDAGDRVDVAPGVPTDRVRWGPILAGTFAALTTLAVLTTLGTAIGLSAYDAGDDVRRYALGTGIWGLLSMILAFGFGGWLTARSAAVRGWGKGTLNGFMVAGVGIPLLLFLLGSAATLMTHAELNRNPAGGMEARQAGATMGDNTGTTAGRAPSAERREEASRTGSRAAWGTLATLVLAIGAASLGGRVGAREDDVDRHRHHHPHTPGTSPAI